jgi:cAMP-dependent protein kinase regulator
MRDLRKIKDEAMEALNRGQWRKAVSCYATLEKEEPAEPAWSLKLGECLRKLGNKDEAIRALSRAAQSYSRQNLVLKAVAVCKIILEVDPSHTESQARIAALFASQSPTKPAPTRVATASTPSSVDLPPAMALERPAESEEADVGEPSTTPLPIFPDPLAVDTQGTVAYSAPPSSPLLRDLQLSNLIPGARQSAEFTGVGTRGAMEIPLDFVEPSRVSFESSRSVGPRTMARVVLPKTPFFSVLSEDLLRVAIDRVTLVKLSPGQILFAQGEQGDALYVVASGEIAVLVPQEVARLSEGEFFGEIALLVGGARMATTRATMETHVLAFDRALLADLLAASPDLLALLLRFVRDRLLSTLAETSPLFAPFSPLERIALASSFQFIEAPQNWGLLDVFRSCMLFFIML